MGLGVTYRIDDEDVTRAIRKLVDLGEDPTPIMRGIAAIGENSTRERFETETAPDGTRWKPSIRARMTGGRTLTRDGHLSGSITSGYGRDHAEWGSNRIYAGIHQGGGEIRAKGGGYLRFRLAGGGFRTVKSVTIPARPFLGLADIDKTDILDLVQDLHKRAMS